MLFAKYSTNSRVEFNEYGVKYYYKNELVHRDNGPAIIFPYGLLEYYKEGLNHREDGPAIIDPYYGEHYYLDDEMIDYEFFDMLTNKDHPNYGGR